jgi:hypothetical protein
MWRSASSASPRFKLPRLAAMVAVALTPWLAAAAARPAAAQAPRFLIESIKVEGVNSSSAQAIVISQSYLKTGQSYTERELQEAVYRVKRLPFVVEADLTLRKGSVRGSYELVVAVEETRPLFVEATPTATYQQPPYYLANIAGLHWASQETVSLRQFVGAGGFAFESVGYGAGDAKTVSVGYTQYNLFGNGSYATLEAAESWDPHLSSVPNLSGTVGIPLSANLTLVIAPQWTKVTLDGLTAVSNDYATSVGVIYRTTDDPIIPTRGADVEATALGSYANFHEIFGYGNIRSYEQFEQLNLSATNYWPITSRQSVGVNLQGFGVREQGPYLFYFSPGSGEGGSAALLYSASLWDDATSRRLGDLRFEASVGKSLLHGFPLVSSGPRLYFAQVAASIGAVYRNQWGLVRLTFIYAGQVAP